MTATTKRQRKLALVRAALASGTPEPYALLRAGVTPAWWRRWNQVDDLADAPRAGRPPRCTVSEADAKTLRQHYLRSNRGRSAGSQSMTARYCASEGLLDPDLCAEILRPRADPCQLPAAVRRVFRTVSAADFARYRDPLAGQGTNDGITTPGWLRMQDDGSGLLEPGQRHVWDDGSVNVGVVVPWTRGGDPCSDKYGVRVARFQLLASCDARCDCITGYGFVMNPTDAYNATNCAHVMFNTWTAAGGAPREVVFEGGVWQSLKMRRFLEQVGVQIIDAKGRPRQKLIENVFNRLWSWLSLTLPPVGQIGRFRGEMKGETQEWLACRAGKRDPRECFPLYTDFLAALNRAIQLYNAKPIKSLTYASTWVPADLYAQRRRESMLPVAESLRRETLPIDVVQSVLGSGVLKTIQDDPHGYKHQYHFATDSLYKYVGARVRLQFDPLSIEEGAYISLADTFLDQPPGTILTTNARCISAAPQMMSDYGWRDARDEARAIKRSSRARVTTAVAALDTRDQFVAPEPQPLPIDFINTPQKQIAAKRRSWADAASETDFDKLAAGIQA